MNNIDAARIKKRISISQIARGTRLSTNTVRLVLGRSKARHRPKPRNVYAVHQFVESKTGVSGGPVRHSASDIERVLYSILSGEKTATQAGAEAGLSKSYLSKILSGKRKIDLLIKVKAQLDKNQ